MSSATGAQYGAAGAGPGTEWRGPWEWGSRRCGGSVRWRPLELVAMVLGFMVFWPIGLAILGWKMCMKGWNRQGDFMAYASERWRSAARGFAGFEQSTRGERWRAFSTGNAAFDDWKAAEMARLEEERRKLDEAHREFGEYLDNLRRARDREEFDSFMSQRRRPPSPEPQQPSPAS